MSKRIWLFLLIGPMALAQSGLCYKLPIDLVDQIHTDLSYLASDDLEGRKPGTKGGGLARDYIAKSFHQSGLSPAFKNGYLQEFTVPNRVERGADANYFFYKGDALKIDEDYYPTKLSANGYYSGKTEYVSFGIEDRQLRRDDIDDEDLRGRAAVMELSSPDGIHPHSKYKDWHDLEKRIKLLKKKGAKAVILVHTEGNANSPESDFKSMNKLSIPVVFVRNAKIAKKLRRSRSVNFSVGLDDIKDQTQNVAGFVDNGQRMTVIIGAHYDHLGWGGEGSRYVETEEPMIHNGADDNASGTAGLLALAKFMSETDDQEYRKFNYLFVAFSAEEMGLLGSKFFAKSLERFDRKWIYMLNMDMIGRMESNVLAINGFGTSPLWKDLIQPNMCDLDLKFSESGVGPSDHTSFYYKNIPVLHFFTGNHQDYHKPSDDAEKINFGGVYRVIGLMASIIRATPPMEDFPFTTTKIESTKAPSFSVTLGVMPDYLYNGSGMKIDGVSPDKPAAAGGLKAGDIVTQLGEVQVSNMQSYMQALSKFKKGDETTVLFKRDGETQSAKIQF